MLSSGITLSLKDRSQDPARCVQARGAHTKSAQSKPPVEDIEDMRSHAVLCPPPPCVSQVILHNVHKDTPEAIQVAVERTLKPHQRVWRKACEQFVAQSAF